MSSSTNQRDHGARSINFLLSASFLKQSLSTIADKLMTRLSNAMYVQFWLEIIDIHILHVLVGTKHLFISIYIYLYS